MKVTSWGKHPVVDGRLSAFREESEARRIIHEPGWIARGLGRSYGDSALSPLMLSSLSFNRFLCFDDESGVLTCESGVSLDDILRQFVPRGWFPHVTPGTKFVTVGGAIASDVHGKNHHAEGSFCRHVIAFDLMLASGEVVVCSRTENPHLFEATAGGMGLTGLILRATIRLRKIETSFIRQESQKAGNLDGIFRLMESRLEWTYSVAWIDTIAGGNKLGRSILYLGEHATLEEWKKNKGNGNPLPVHRNGKFNVPFDLPPFTLNRFSISLFNGFLYGNHPSRLHASMPGYDPYFYPLDVIHNWNRIYGKPGFTQYQFVLPRATAFDGIREVLETCRKAGIGSFLSVLKWFGPQDTGMISFPMEGYTMTLDFPVTEKLYGVLRSLDETVMKGGGRLYLTKDMRMDAGMMRTGYPRWEEFLAIVNRYDPEGKIRSLQSARIRG